MGVALSEVIGRFYIEYEKAKQNPYIKKPISNALYKTWRWAEAKERPREKTHRGESGSCEFCKYQHRKQHERPCSLCKHNFMDNFEFMDKFEKEDNADADSD